LKKILLIGSEGYIASKLYLSLSVDKFDVYKVDNLSKNGKKNISKNTIIENYQDLDESFLSEFDNCIWLAGHSSVNDSLSDPNGALNNNFFDFIEFRQKFPNRLIYASSGSVYSRQLPEYCDENSPTMVPDNVYDFTKISFDNYLKSNNKEGVGLRFGTVNGVGKNIKSELMLNSMVKASKTGQITVMNKKFFRPILWIDDLVRAILAILNSEIQSGIYNLASFNSSIGEMAKEVSSITGADIVDKGESSTYNFMMKTERFEKEFNFEFEGSIKAIVDSLVDFEY